MAAAHLYLPFNLPDETCILAVFPRDYHALIVYKLSPMSLSKNTVPYEAALSYY
jgi:hypothetical protein